MATHTQIGATVDAFQWNGGQLGTYALPAWASAIALQTPGDGTLNVPESTARGTNRANPGDWIVRVSNGHIDIMAATTFALLYV